MKNGVEWVHLAIEKQSWERILTRNKWKERLICQKRKKTINKRGYTGRKNEFQKMKNRGMK